MNTMTAFPELKSTGVNLDLDHVDFLKESASVASDVETLRQRMTTHGYLYMPGLLKRDRVLDARRSICQVMQDGGFLDDLKPMMEAIPNPKKGIGFKPEYATGNPVVEKLLYTGEMIEFFDRFFGKPTMHYDFTWLRTVSPGPGTPSHCDVVYMGRGETQQLFTVWTPLGDIDFAQGGLMVLDGSNRYDPLKRNYGQHDVDTFCTNKEKQDGWRDGIKWLPDSDVKGTSGSIGNDPNAIRNAVGGTWRTTEFKAGDALIFTCYTVHASLDNTSDRIRLSTDSRYQPSGTVLDERWVGSNPIAHSQAGKRGKIC